MKILLVNRLKENLANIITFIGFVDAFALLVIAIYNNPELLWLIDFLFVMGCLTDLIDGPIARKLKIETLIGSLLDRLRDRALIYPTLAVLIWHHRWNFTNLVLTAQVLTIVFVVIIIGLEILLLIACSVGVIWFLGGAKIDLQPNKWGRKKAFSSFIVVLIWLFSLTIEKYQGFPMIKYSIFVIDLGLILMIYWAYKSLEEYCKRGSAK